MALANIHLGLAQFPNPFPVRLYRPSNPLPSLLGPVSLSPTPYPPPRVSPPVLGSAARTPPVHTQASSLAQPRYTPHPLHDLPQLRPTRPAPQTPHPMHTQLKSDISKPNPKYNLHSMVTSSPLSRSPLPKSHKLALTDPN